MISKRDDSLPVDRFERLEKALVCLSFFLVLCMSINSRFVSSNGYDYKERGLSGFSSVKWDPIRCMAREKVMMLKIEWLRCRLRAFGVWNHKNLSWFSLSSSSIWGFSHNDRLPKFTLDMSPKLAIQKNLCLCLCLCFAFVGLIMERERTFLFLCSLSVTTVHTLKVWFYFEFTPNKVDLRLCLVVNFLGKSDSGQTTVEMDSTDDWIFNFGCLLIPFSHFNFFSKKKNVIQFNKIYKFKFRI